jgi:RNA polymerase I-specific transcription initiation factor RRN6
MRAGRSDGNDQSLHEIVAGLEKLTVDNSAPSLITRRVTCDLFLSLYSMMYKRAELFNNIPSSIPPEIQTSMPLEDEILIDNERGARFAYIESLASSQPSTPTSSAASEVTVSEAAASTECQSIAIIREYIGSGKLVPEKRVDLVSAWSLGAEPSSHIWSISKTTEITPGMERRARQEAREARKRKRREALNQLAMEHKIMSATQPAPETRFYSQASQPLVVRSQSQTIPSSPGPASLIPMSQPVAGAFGGRTSLERPKKRLKRKGGF